MSAAKDYGIYYLRPDGWWEAGRGWDSSEEATEAAEDHDWGGSTWKVAEVGTVELCSEAIEDLRESGVEA